MASRRSTLGPISILAPLVFSMGCATASRDVAAQLEHDRAELKQAWSFMQNQSGDVLLGDYLAVNIGPRRDQELPAYGFTVTHRVAPGWEVVGMGLFAVRGMKVMVIEHMELSPDVAGANPWLLDLASSEAFQLTGSLRTAGERYEVVSVSSGAVLTGEEYGADAICFLRDDRVVAAVEFGGNDSAVVRVRRGLDAAHESVLAAAATAVTLRRHTLRETGSALRGPRALGLGATPCATNTYCDNGAARQLVPLTTLPGI